MVDIQCPGCNTKYRIDERILPAENPTFKCSRCDRVFGVAGTAPPRSSPLKATAACLAALVLCAAALAWTMQLWRADPGVPLAGDFNLTIAGHDLYAELLAVKSLCDSGWIFTNPDLGAPFGMQAYDAPNLDPLDTAAMKLISLATCNAPLILNIYFLLTFPLTVLASIFVLRQFDVSYPSSAAASLLFAFLPYHFLRGEAHILLAAYWTIPPAVMLMLWAWLDESNPGPDGKTGGWSRAKWIAALACAAMAGLAHAYYGCFAIFLMMVAGIGGFARTGKGRNLGLALLFSAIIGLGIAASIAPSIVYSAENGVNTAAVARLPQESEFLSLKIARLLLPVTGHRIPALAELKDSYNRALPSPTAPWLPKVLGKSPAGVVNESDTQTLGAIAGIGFLYLLASLLWIRNAREPLQALAILNLAALLMGTAGGLGSVFNFTVSAQIRGYNRLSVFIAFFSLFAAAVLLDDLASALARGIGRLGAAFIWYPLLALILIAGLLDQTTPDFVPDYSRTKAEYQNDAKFVHRIESSLPEGAMVFQLPFGPFPEQGAIQRMWGWDLLKGYLHSSALKWSYGIMLGRPEASWVRKFAGKPAGQVLPLLAFAGFDGIYIDRYGYDDNGAALEKSLSGALHESPIVSADGRLSFFSMENYDKSLRANYTPVQWLRQHESALELPLKNEEINSR